VKENPHLGGREDWTERRQISGAAQGQGIHSWSITVGCEY
jgi:hypothetical protein